MRATFNAQERTLREMAALTLTAGWKIIDVVHAEGSLFGHMTAIPVEIPEASLALLEPPVVAPEVPSAGTMVLHSIPVEFTKNISAGGGTRTRSGSVASASDTVRRGETFGTLSHLPTEEAIRKPTRRDRKPLIPWWRGRKDSQTSKNGKPTTPESPAYGLRAQKGRPKLAIVTSSPGPPTYLRSALRSPPIRTASMVRLSAHDSDRTAFSSPETTPDHTKIAHETVVLQGALLPEPEPSPMLLPALEPAPPRLRTMSSRTSLRKKASQVFEFSKASVASLRSAALGGGSSPHAVPPVPPLPPMPPVPPIPHAHSYGGLTPEMARRPGDDAGDDGGSAAVKSLRKMRSRSQLGLARVHVEVHSGRARDAGRVERIERDSDE